MCPSRAHRDQMRPTFSLSFHIFCCRSAQQRSVSRPTRICFSYNLTAIKVADRDVRMLEAFALEQERLASSSSSSPIAGPAWMTADLAPDHASQSLARLRELLDLLLSARCEDDAVQRLRLWTR